MLNALQLNMVELTIGSKSLAEAFNEYMRESAEDYGGPQTDVGSAKSVMKKLTTQYMGCPALVLCDEYQVRTEVSLEASVEQHGCMDAVALQALENDLTHWLSQEEREMDPSPKLQALRVTCKLWNCLTPLIRDVPHVYVYACGRSLSLALIGKQMLPHSPSPTDCTVSLFLPSFACLQP